MTHLVSETLCYHRLFLIIDKQCDHKAHSLLTSLYCLVIFIHGLQYTCSCNMNAFISFDLFMVYIPECKQQLNTMK
jgi:hypothetical protein